ncbi:MAG: sulfotransferase domain-containing protein [Proteobacteria bacterium]|nr:sulfotransferase domain-containing protein [Pseudomonadota bacterium]
MKYWIASYPRSGNTFFRILLQEVYGVKTWEGYGNESPKKVIKHLENNNPKANMFIKTHDLPEHTEIPQSQLKTIYLVRDGRDAVVSMAFHRKNIVKVGSNYMFNLRAIILAPFNTVFGGWSKHVSEWLECADVVIKFEDLIANPLDELKRIERLIELPVGDYSKIPTFQDLKIKNYGLGSGNSNLSEKDSEVRRKKFFRAGKTKTYKDNIPQPLLDIFNNKNRITLKQQGYEVTNNSKFIFPNLILQYTLCTIGFVVEKFNKNN